MNRVFRRILIYVYGESKRQSKKYYCSQVDIKKIRNLGILAHIDAGKTTTSERMLYFTGLIKQMGEVHHGNTVTDYMSQERERGITITSAAVTMKWKDYRFNLIDTPGHIDFTMEVEQALGVLDGAVVLLDSSAGVEAQTLTVWRQAERYNIPKIIFLNKMDRLDANFEMCLKSIQNKLQIMPLCLQLPIKENGKLVGIVDLLHLKKIFYSGLKSRSEDLQSTDCNLWERALDTREKLIDNISLFDDALVEEVLGAECLNDIKGGSLQEALRRITKKQAAVPVIMGSAYKNIGIQPLMDGIISYLPSPDEVCEKFGIFKDQLCAKAFKVIHDKQKGPLVFFRLYNGEISKNKKIYVISQEKADSVNKLYIAFADEFRDVENISAGNIAVVTGLKRVRMGDLITSSASSYEIAKKQASKHIKNDEICIETYVGMKANTPQPVFFCSIEPESLAYQAQLDLALIELQREDPSFKVTQNAQTGQTVLGGMGELHLDVIKHRIMKDYKVNVQLGPLQIVYQEAPLSNETDCIVNSTTIGKFKQAVEIKMSLLVSSNNPNQKILIFDKTPEAASNISHIYHKHLAALREGVEFGLTYGPRISSKVVNAQIMLHYLVVGRGTTEAYITATATELVKKLVKKSNSQILEPIMDMEIVCNEEHLSVILDDLGRRRSLIQDITIRSNTKVVKTETPLSELMGYSTTLRTLSSGTATFTMEFSTYRGMSAIEEEKAIKSIRGF